MAFAKALKDKKTVIILFALILAALFLVFAKYAYSVPAGDSQFFLVPAIQFAKNGLLVSPLFPDERTMDLIIDPTGARRFLFEPPLFPLVLSWLMPVASAHGIFWSLAFINIAVLFLTAFLFYRVVKLSNINGQWSRVLLVILSVTALASSLAETGRPETLVRLFVTLALFVHFYVPKKYDWIFYGIFLGLISATHPALGVISIFVLGIYFGSVLPFNKIILKTAALFLTAFPVALGMISLGPFGVKETVEGVWANAVTVSHGISLGAKDFLKLPNLINYYFTSQSAPFYGFVIVLTVIAGFFFFFKYRQKIFSLRTTIFFGSALIAVLVKLVFSAGHIFYITAFAPLIFLILFHFFLKTGFLGKFLTVSVLVLVSVGIIRTTLLFPFFLRQHPTLKEARANFAEIISAHLSSLIGITGSLWPLTENYKNVYSYNSWPEKPKPGTGLVFFGQRYSGLLSPPKIKGCEIINDKFSKKIPKLLGFKLGSTMPGYGYAVYNCLENENK